MQSDIKIAIIPDTNVFTYSKNKIYDLSKLPLDEYYKIQKTLELNDLTYEVNILFPEIVILELLHHLEVKLSNKCKDLEKLDNEFHNFREINISNNDLDTKKFCEKLKNKYFKELKVIPIPTDRDILFNEILEMSIDKKPPFIESSSDKGFKDAILFLSLLKFAEDNKFDKYIIFSKDKGFFDNRKELVMIFKNHLTNIHNNDIYNSLEIIKNKTINSYITDEFELFIELKEYISYNFFKMLEKTYDDVSLINIDFNEYDMDDYELIREDTSIHQLDDNEFEVEFFFNIWINCPRDYFNVFDRFETKTITQSESYVFYKENGEWQYYLNSRSYDIE